MYSYFRLLNMRHSVIPWLIDNLQQLKQVIFLKNHANLWDLIRLNIAVLVPFIQEINLSLVLWDLLRWLIAQWLFLIVLHQRNIHCKDSWVALANLQIVRFEANPIFTNKNINKHQRNKDNNWKGEKNIPLRIQSYQQDALFI